MKEERCPHTRSPFAGGDCRWRRRELRSHGGERSHRVCGGQSGETPARRLGAEQHSPAQEACLLPRRGGRGWELRLWLRAERRERPGVGGVNTA